MCKRCLCMVLQKIRQGGVRFPDFFLWDSLRVGVLPWLSAMDLFSDLPEKQNRALSVTQLVRKMKRAIEAGVGKLWIEGEVSNLRKQASGHWYFSLKDDSAQIQCAMFHARNKDGSEFLGDGTLVRAFADATVYAARGQLQLVVERVELAGQGGLQAKFEALKQKLKLEGLFDVSRKKSLPAFPRTIGLITSPTGAALQDMRTVLQRRAPWVQLVLYPVRVQGRGVEREIARAIHRMSCPQKYGFPQCDVLIVGRGGGSLEDLWCFNEEIVARAIFESEIPILSAVGHEIDFTIADFVADVRAPTPSAAAELAVPDVAELQARVGVARTRLRRSLQGALREPAQQMDRLHAQLTNLAAREFQRKLQAFRELFVRHGGLHPRQIIRRKQEHADALGKGLRRVVESLLRGEGERILQLQSMIRTLGPESAFKRGFSITLRADGSLLRSAKGVQEGDALVTKLLDGEVSSEVQSPTI